ncbi:putative membrane protein [Microbacterium halimionae]|uniref:Putative membrane protein n=1 Tax=Microbacterium halimionae TaxID=1526413 RepID=A0A7W3PM79_9MICO|nr:DUF6113 family protein [Microbacterium halimionae]MBA8817305.1 putative membrane protein [Microbacterium halimionae]NII95939.1 putative membrane protein [Microbacterium halimionae]
MNLGRIGAWVVSLVVGAVYGAAGTISQAYMLWGVPLGLVIAVVACAAVLAAIRLLSEDRWSTLAAGVGMVLTTLVLSGTGPGGSVVVEASTLGVVWTVAVPLVVAIVVAWPDLRSPSSADA